MATIADVKNWINERKGHCAASIRLRKKEHEK
jgi:hypothetical protein